MHKTLKLRGEFSATQFFSEIMQPWLKCCQVEWPLAWILVSVCPWAIYPDGLIFESTPPQNLGRNYINKTHTTS